MSKSQTGEKNGMFGKHHSPESIQKMIVKKGGGIEKRFWNFVAKTDYCWNWIGSKNDGYGQIGLGSKLLRAHRFSYQLHNGEIPKGMFVCHKCDNRACVNPDHLWLGTNEENQKDMRMKHRDNYGSYNGEKHHKAKLVKENIPEIKKLYKSGKFTQQELAELFGVHQTVISYIILNKIWQHI